MTLSRRGFVGLAVGGAAAGGLALAGLRSGHGLPRVDAHVLDLDDLPEAFDGFRVLLLSDVHAGADMKASRMSAIVCLVNNLEADLVVIAGDMIDGRATDEDIRGFADAFSRLESTHGVIAVPGNHDHFAGIAAVARELRGAGLTLLAGDHRDIERSGSRIVVLGVDDPMVAVFDPPQDDAVSAVSARRPEGTLAVLAAHRPAAFDAAVRCGISLTLSGHTHGGQIGLPLRNLTPVRFATRYVRGHYQRGGSHLIVSSGVGTSGLPIRVGVPPSVALVTLRTSGKASEPGDASA